MHLIFTRLLTACLQGHVMRKVRSEGFVMRLDTAAKLENVVKLSSLDVEIGRTSKGAFVCAKDGDEIVFSAFGLDGDELDLTCEFLSVLIGGGLFGRANSESVCKD